MRLDLHENPQEFRLNAKSMYELGYRIFCNVSFFIVLWKLSIAVLLVFK
jgi:hypothetical protein